MSRTPAARWDRGRVRAAFPSAILGATRRRPALHLPDRHLVLDGWWLEPGVVDEARRLTSSSRTAPWTPCRRTGGFMAPPTASPGRSRPERGSIAVRRYPADYPAPDRVL